MDKEKRNIRQEKLAKLFFEMGMELPLVSKICGIKEEKWKKMIGKNN